MSMNLKNLIAISPLFLFSVYFGQPVEMGEPAKAAGLSAASEPFWAIILHFKYFARSNTQIR